MSTGIQLLERHESAGGWVELHPVEQPHRQARLLRAPTGQPVDVDESKLVVVKLAPVTEETEVL